MATRSDRPQPEDPVTKWLESLKAGSYEDVEQLWKWYEKRLLRYAKVRIKAPRTAADEEDVAISAFHSLCRCVKEGRFEQMESRSNLEGLLFCIAARKSWKLVSRELKRPENAATSGLYGLTDKDVAALSPDAEDAMIDEVRHLFQLLEKYDGRDHIMQEIVLGRLEGRTHREIAEKTGKSIPTIERKAKRIREIWIASEDNS